MRDVSPFADHHGLDLLDTKTFANGHPVALYDHVRTNAPVLRHPGSAKQPPFWALTRHADITRVGLDGENFTSTQGFRLQTDKRASMDPEIGRVLSRFMLAMDDPEHAAFRRLVSSAFLPASLKRIEQRVAIAAADMLDTLRGRDEVDFVADIAATVPIRTICAMLGVPRADEDRIIGWTDGIFATDDPEVTLTIEEANQKYLAIFDYAMWLITEKRRNPADDLMSLVAHAEIDGALLTEIEQKSYFSNMMGAGNETTRTSLAGAAWTLSQHADERAKINADPALLANGVSEMLRYFTPVYQMARTAVRDVTIDDCHIRPGERVVMLYGAGNRDPDMFADPHRFDVTRTNAGRHISFGIGIHHCLGTRLAQLQLRIILGAFLERYPRYACTNAPVFLGSNFVAAVKRLPVRLCG